MPVSVYISKARRFIWLSVVYATWLCLKLFILCLPIFVKIFVSYVSDNKMLQIIILFVIEILFGYCSEKFISTIVLYCGLCWIYPTLNNISQYVGTM